LVDEICGAPWEERLLNRDYAKVCWGGAGGISWISRLHGDQPDFGNQSRIQEGNLRYSDKLWTINAKWTAMMPRYGWRHFRVSARRYEAGELQLEMMAVCDREVRFWIPQLELHQGELWQPGWDRLTKG